MFFFLSTFQTEKMSIFTFLWLKNHKKVVFFTLSSLKIHGKVIPTEASIHFDSNSNHLFKEYVSVIFLSQCGYVICKQKRHHSEKRSIFSRLSAFKIFFSKFDIFVARFSRFLGLFGSIDILFFKYFAF